MFTAFRADNVGLYGKSRFLPPHIITKLRRADGRGRIFRNLTVVEKKALSELMANMSINIKPANKGRALVVMDTKKYMEEIYGQLSDSALYEKLEMNPTDNFKAQLNLLLETSRSEICD